MPNWELFLSTSSETGCKGDPWDSALNSAPTDKPVALQNKVK